MGVFVGRAREQAWLSAFLERVAHMATPQVAVVIGEAGVGKSTLLDQVLAGKKGDARVLRVFGFEPERWVPLAAAQQIVRAALTGTPRQPNDQIALFEAVHRELARDGRSLVVVVDDLQWVDEDSRALLHYLLRGRSAFAARNGLGLLLAHRPDPGASAFVESCRHLLGAQVRVEELGPLSPEEGVELASQLGALAADDVSRRAAGSPFWINVLATSAEHAGDARQIVERRLATLDADAADLLSLLSVAGRPLPHEDAAAVLGWPPMRLQLAVDRLVSAGLGRAGRALASPAHDLIREAVSDGLPAAARMRFHRKLAIRFEEIAAGDVRLLREALTHRTACGDVARDLALTMALSPYRRLLGSDGLQDLVTIADALPTARDAAELHEAIARLAGELGEHTTALRLWRLVLGVANDAHAGEVAQEALRAALGCEEAGEARQLVDDLRRILMDIPDAALDVTADALEATVARWLEGKPDEARILSERAIAGARRLADTHELPVLDERARRAYLDALAAANDAAMQAIERTRMLDLARETIEVAAGAERSRRLAATYQLGVAQDMNAQYAECEATMREVWEEADRWLLPQLRIDSGYFLALTRLHLGRVDDAREVVREVAALLDRLGGHLRFGNRIAGPLALTEILAGDWRAGLDLLDADVGRQPDPHSHGRVLMLLGAWTARLSGAGQDTSAARDPATIIRVAVTKAEASGCPRCTQEAYVVGADALATAGKQDDAARLLGAWHRVRPAEANLAERLHAARASARLHPSGEAVDTLRSAIAEADEKGHVVDVVLGWMTVAQLSPVITQSEAEDAISLAGRLAARHGLSNLEALARKWARSRGYRTWRLHRREPASGLTRREIEVVQRIVEGATNAEIAASLFISPRTVDRHVENILRKVGARNRAALASAARINGWFRG